MSDNLRRYCAIHSALLQLYPSEPTGNLARHLKTLAALVCGIVGSKKCHLPAVADKAPDGRKRESRTAGSARAGPSASLASCKTQRSRLKSSSYLMPRRWWRACRPARWLWSWTAAPWGAAASPSW